MVFEAYPSRWLSAPLAQEGFPERWVAVFSVRMAMEWKVDNATRKWKNKGLEQFHARVMAGFRAWQLCHPECRREALWLNP